MTPGGQRAYSGWSHSGTYGRKIDPMTGLSRTNPHPFEHAYTDEPALQRNLILGSLHLVFWLYFHPSAWRHYVNRLDPTLSETFALTQLNRSHWRNPRLLRLLAQGYGVWPVLAGLSVGLTLWVRLLKVLLSRSCM
jgi:hypothetical protein